MPETPAPKLTAAEPQLFVGAMADSLAFYNQKLGFAVAFTYGDPPFYAQIVRDAARVNLRALNAQAIDPDLRDRERLLSASITVDNIAALAEEFQAAGIELAQPLRTEDWGARTFIVRDADGNLILFAGK
jgi:catechol 2,3-dioxygenase-like lactoylglutathione lyase family enzyme